MRALAFRGVGRFSDARLPDRRRGRSLHTLTSGHAVLLSRRTAARCLVPVVTNSITPRLVQPVDPLIADAAGRIAARATRELEALVAVSSPSGDVAGAEEATAVAAALAPDDAVVERVP